MAASAQAMSRDGRILKAGVPSTPKPAEGNRLRESEDLKPGALAKVPVEAERALGFAAVDDRERDRVAEAPVLVGVLDEQLAAGGLIVGRGTFHLESAHREPLPSDHAA